MCSWCYGFGPELAALLERLPGLPVEVVVGGLRPYNKGVMDAALKKDLQEQWQKVAERTGLPFSFDFFTKENFVYDTEPACRAVVAARLIAPQASLYVFHEIQRAFYSEGKDVTDGKVLASIATKALAEQGHAVSEADFLATWNSDVVIKATNDDFLLSEKWEIRGFPTLILERGKQLDLVTAGYVAMPRLVELLETLVGQDAEQGNASA
jgi:putative protein-disulfide isomerase